MTWFPRAKQCNFSAKIVLFYRRFTAEEEEEAENWKKRLFIKNTGPKILFSPYLTHEIVRRVQEDEEDEEEGRSKRTRQREEKELPGLFVISKSRCAISGMQRATTPSFGCTFCFCSLVSLSLRGEKNGRPRYLAPERLVELPIIECI